jgi:hypothetical protein
MRSSPHFPILVLFSQSLRLLKVPAYEHPEVMSKIVSHRCPISTFFAGCPVIARAEARPVPKAGTVYFIFLLLKDQTHHARIQITGNYLNSGDLNLGYIIKTCPVRVTKKVQFLHNILVSGHNMRYYI